MIEFLRSDGINLSVSIIKSDFSLRNFKKFISFLIDSFNDIVLDDKGCNRLVALNLDESTLVEACKYIVVFDIFSFEKKSYMLSMAETIFFDIFIERMSMLMAILSIETLLL